MDINSNINSNINIFYFTVSQYVKLCKVKIIKLKNMKGKALKIFYIFKIV